MSAKSFFRDRQTDGRSRTSEDSTIIDAVLTPLHRLQSCSESLSDELRDRDRESMQRGNVQHWVDRKCLGAFCVTCTWFDTHRRGFRDRWSQLSDSHREAQDLEVRFEATRGSPRRMFEQKEKGKRECSNSLSRFREARWSPAGKNENQQNFPAGKKRPNFRLSRQSQTPAGKMPAMPALRRTLCII